MKLFSGSRDFAQVIPAKPELLCLIGVMVVVFLGVWSIHHGVLQDFPNSADEHAYLFQAQLFAAGQCTASAHPLQEFLSPFYILHYDGKIFSLFPPGWPLILSLGVYLGVPHLLNPLLSALTVPVLFGLGWMLQGRRGAWLSVGLLVFSPFFLFNAASYFSHPACLLMISVVLLFLLLWEKTKIGWMAMIAGFMVSWAFSIREWTAVLVLIVPCWMAWKRSEHRVRFLVLFLAGFLPGFMYYLAYNQAVTGKFWMTPRFLHPGERLGFGEREIRVFDYVETQYYGMQEALIHLLRNGGRLGLWTFPGLPLLATWGAWRARKHPWMLVMLVSTILLPLGYMLYPSEGGNQYGPRFYYESLVFLCLLAGNTAQEMTHRWSKKTLIVLISILMMTDGWMFVTQARFYSNQIYERRTLFRLVEFRRLHDAVVFVASPSGDMTQGDLIRNLPDPDEADVVYAWHLGAKDRELAKLFPERTCYLYSRDPRTGAVSLQQLAF